TDLLAFGRGFVIGTEIPFPPVTAKFVLHPQGLFSGWHGRWFDHQVCPPDPLLFPQLLTVLFQNLRDDRVEVFTSCLMGGIHEYSYITRATTFGEFVAPPTLVLHALQTPY